MRVPRAAATCSFLVLSLLAAAVPAWGAASPPALWRDADEALLAASGGARLVVPERYRTVALDAAALRALLATAPLEWSGGEPAVLALPMPDGALARFRFEESPIMEAGLAARYPEVRTYRGQGIDDPAATARFGWTSAGFHAILLSPRGTVYIDPYRRGDVEHYVSYFKRDFRKPEAASFTCAVHGDDASPLSATSEASSAAPSAAFSGLSAGGGTLRTYRLAQAANFEYTLFHSGGLPNLPSKQAAIERGIVPTINRVNAIYERDLAVHMNLIDGIEALVWDQPADPYVNEEGTSMLVTNQVTLDALVGNDAYDIGHVFSTGGGGIAGLGVVCNDLPSPANRKAWGVTGLPAPVGDPFDVDFVAHEMGHQYGGNHTFNGTTGSCSGNANADTAFEVGSGSTIQAYAGICRNQNLQPHSDDYFHNISYVEMREHTTGPADGCAAKTGTGNTPPAVEAGPAFTIPARTPFVLTASGSDADGDALTYTWEEMDLGPLGDGRTDNGSSPILRSFAPTASPARTFPRLADLLGNSTTYGEILPTTSRTMTFRVTARDNRAGGGEVAWDETQVAVTAAAGPFLVTAPNGGESWTGGAPATVAWDVANTTAAPVGAAAVDIRLSVDGGATFPILLAAGTPNDGSAEVTAPNVATTTARVRVQGAGNVFFDLSNGAFVIEPGSGTPFAADDEAQTAAGTPVRIDVLANDSDPNGDPLSIVAVQSPTDGGGTAVRDGEGVLYTPAAGFAGTDAFTYTIGDGTATDSAVVTVRVDAGSVACEDRPAALAASELADGLGFRSGDGDAFVDNCEGAELAFAVANTGGTALTNVRIVAIRPVSHPATRIETALPAAVAAALPSPCGGATPPARGSFRFTGAGLAHGDTLLFEVDLTADQLAPAVATATLAVRDVESDATAHDVTFGFEAGLDGWQVVRGTFDRTDLGGGAEGPTSFYLASSSLAPDQCDQARSPVLRLSSTSTLSLSNQFATEPGTEVSGFYDRANVGLFDPAAGARATVSPDGGDRLYNVPAGSAAGSCVTEGQAGWAGAGPGWLGATWSAAALGVAGVGPGGRELAIDVAYGTDGTLEGAGFWFDRVTVTDVLELGPDAQPDACSGGGGTSRGHVQGSGHLATHPGAKGKAGKLHFSFEAAYDPATGALGGKLEAQDKDAGVKIQVGDDGILALTPGSAPCNGVAPGPGSFELVAEGTFNGAPGARFRACGSDGSPDRFVLECTAGCSYASPARTPDDALDGGNIHLRESIVLAGSAETGGGSGSGAPPAGGETSIAVLALDPLLLTQAPAGTPLLLTVVAHPYDGAAAAGREIALHWRRADGTTGSVTRLADALGVAVFALTVPTGETEYVARAGALESNGVQLTGTGLLP